MGSVSTRLDDDLEEEIRETAERRDESIAEVVREMIEKGQDYERLKTENERLKNEKRHLIEKMEENQQLVEYVNDEQKLLRKREKRQMAPVWKRAKWWLLGDDQNVLADDDMNNE